MYNLQFMEGLLKKILKLYSLSNQKDKNTSTSSWSIRQ